MSSQISPGDEDATRTAGPSRSPRWGVSLPRVVANLGLLMFSLVFALALAEGLSRLVLPVREGRTYIADDGSQLQDPQTPSVRYRQVATEFDAVTTISERGFRIPDDSPEPDVLFLGDSFTFGIGLGDPETFPSIYCNALQRTCVNMGHPGTGTTRQVDALERELITCGCAPGEVKLFILAMTASIFAGNDLSDVWRHDRALRADSSRAGAGSVPDTESTRGRELSGSLLGRLMANRATIFAVSNLARVAKFYWGPQLRTRFLPGFEGRRLVEALALMRHQLDRLDRLSREYGFKYQIYVIHPVQDLTNGTYAQTITQLEAIAPRAVLSTAALFQEDPESYYYGYDGHLNASGARRIADFLMAEGRSARP